MHSGFALPASDDEADDAPPATSKPARVAPPQRSERRRSGKPLESSGDGVSVSNLMASLSTNAKPASKPAGGAAVTASSLLSSLSAADSPAGVDPTQGVPKGQVINYGISSQTAMAQITAKLASTVRNAGFAYLPASSPHSSPARAALVVLCDMDESASVHLDAGMLEALDAVPIQLECHVVAAPNRWSHTTRSERVTWCDAANPRLLAAPLDAASPEDRNLELMVLCELQDSSRRVWSVITDIVSSGIPAERIVLAGFGLGGTCAVHTAGKNKLAGAISIGGGVSLCNHQGQDGTHKSATEPVLLIHGSKNSTVPLQFAEDCASFLSKNRKVAAKIRVLQNGEHKAGPAEYLALSQAVEAMLCEGYTSSVDKLNAAALDISSYSNQTPEGDLKQELEKIELQIASLLATQKEIMAKNSKEEIQAFEKKFSEEMTNLQTKKVALVNVFLM